MTLDHKAPIFAGGTPKGRGLFHRLCMQAKKKPDQKFYSFSSYDNPFIDRKTIDEIAESMPSMVRAQEIEGKFISDESTVFDSEKLKDCIKGTLQPPIEHQQYYGGLDLGRVKDFSVLTIMNENNHLCFFQRVRHFSWDYQRKWIHAILTRYNNPVCNCDASNVSFDISSNKSTS